MHVWRSSKAGNMFLFLREKKEENKDSGGDVPMDWLVIRCEACSLDREPSRAWWQGYGLTCKPPPPRNGYCFPTSCESHTPTITTM